VIKLVDRVSLGCRQIEWMPQSWESWQWGSENLLTAPRVRDTSYRFAQTWIPIALPAWVPA